MTEKEEKKNFIYWVLCFTFVGISLVFISNYYNIGWNNFFATQTNVRPAPFFPFLLSIMPYLTLGSAIVALMIAAIKWSRKGQEPEDNHG